MSQNYYERDEVLQRKVVRAMVVVLGVALIAIPTVYAYTVNREKEEISVPALVKIPKEDAKIYARACEGEKECVIYVASGQRVHVRR